MKEKNLAYSIEDSLKEPIRNIWSSKSIINFIYTTIWFSINMNLYNKLQPIKVLEKINVESYNRNYPFRK